ncbi:MAG: hypothetical protein OHK0038_03030 [Flammeovirgaceae bacterium]
MKNLTIFFLLYLFLRLCAYAQDSTQTTITPRKEFSVKDLMLEETTSTSKVISASRSTKNVEDLPVTVYVITQEEIIRNGYTTLVDVLKMVPGIRTSKPGSGLSGEMFLMRGLIGNDYCKILVNNVPIQPFVTGTLPIGEQLPIAQAERIEVIFGPASAVYGADAMSGVINIITKNVKQGSFAEANAAIGQRGYRHVNFMAGGKAGKNKNIIQYTFYGSKGSRDDMNLKNSNKNNHNALIYFPRVFNLGNNPQEIRKTLEYLNSNHGEAMNIMTQVFPHYQGLIDKPTIGKYPHDSYLMGTKIQYKNLQLSIDEMRRQDHSSLGLNTMIFSHANPDTYYAEKMQRFALSAQGTYGKLNFMSNISYLRYRLDNRSSAATNYNNGANGRSYIYQTSDDIFAEGLMNYNLTKHLEFSAGISYLISSYLPETNESITPIPTSSYRPFKKDKYQVNELLGDFGFYPNVFRNMGGFFQLFYQKKRWSLLFSRRWDMPSDYSSQAYNRAAVLFKTSKKSSLRASWGYAFKTPSPFRRYSSTAYLDRSIDIPSLDKVFYAQVPNPSLEPEELNNIEFGYRYLPNQSWEFDVSLYLQNTDKFISALSVPLDTVLYSNFSQNSYMTRVYANDSLTRSSLVGLQMTLRAKNLSQKYKLNADLNLHFASGQEVLPNAGLKNSNGDYLPISDGDTIDVYRQMPVFMGQLRINFMPTSKLYINLDNTFMSSWYRRYMIDELDFNDPNSKSKGFYNLDLVLRYNFSKTFGAHIKVLNVFDASYGGIDATGLDIDMVQNPQLGRNIQFGINFAKF